MFHTQEVMMEGSGTVAVNSVGLPTHSPEYEKSTVIGWADKGFIKLFAAENSAVISNANNILCFIEVCIALRGW